MIPSGFQRGGDLRLALEAPAGGARVFLGFGKYGNRRRCHVAKKTDLGWPDEISLLR
jgi:hypothetical protein